MIDLSPANSEIEKYFSIYSIFKKNAATHISSLFIDKSIEYATHNNFIKNKDLSTILQFDIVLIDNTDQEYRIQNNLNIVNQDGAFIFNASPTEPLERQYLNTRESFLKIAQKKNLDFKFLKEVGVCLNINKKLVRQIALYLKDKGIDRNSIYPDLYKLKIDCLNLE